MKLVCIGNSIVRGAPGPREKSFCAVLEKLTGWEVVNKGVESQTTMELMERFQEDVVDQRPDMVLILNGPADFTFLGMKAEDSGRNYFAMARKAADAGIVPVLITPMLTEPKKASVMWLKRQNIDYHVINHKLQQLRDIFLEGPFATADLQQAYPKCGQTVDGIHPTEEGYAFIGNFLASELMQVTRGLGIIPQGPA